MGLDMYLYAEKHIDSYDYETDQDGKLSRVDNIDYENIDVVSGLSKMPTGDYGGITISKCVAYWRKANAVHGWIVRNLANGVDECQRIHLDREDLIRLRNDCLVALNHRGDAIKEPDNEPVHTEGMSAEQVTNALVERIKQESARVAETTTATYDNPIPPMAGFFFGGTDLTDYYFETLANTAETINCLLASDTEGEYRYYYQASW